MKVERKASAPHISYQFGENERHDGGPFIIYEVVDGDAQEIETVSSEYRAKQIVEALNAQHTTPPDVISIELDLNEAERLVRIHDSSEMEAQICCLLGIQP